MDDFVVDHDEFGDDILEEYNDDEHRECIPTGFASSSDFGGDRPDPHGKRIREKSRGIAIEKELWKQKVAKLAVAVDTNSGKPVEKNGKILITF
ncbi:hypothetical protein TorRG33x02_232840 [Trema orientale]|uniref:Uncharacterized protein n=1 Tax=Trema orientale TaxID=63057 RepID=A0A2P5E5Z1_TREOI|nr:hypothetical protein TorRG33x02_232840 [Trema orientale]